MLDQPAIAAAAYFGLEKTVRALLMSKADFRAVDKDGYNALHASALAGHANITLISNCKIGASSSVSGARSI